jgi:hypothetical protein
VFARGLVQVEALVLGHYGQFALEYILKSQNPDHIPGLLIVSGYRGMSKSRDFSRDNPWTCLPAGRYPGGEEVNMVEFIQCKIKRLLRGLQGNPGISA